MVRHEQNGFIKFLTVCLLLLKVRNNAMCYFHAMHGQRPSSSQPSSHSQMLFVNAAANLVDSVRVTSVVQLVRSPLTYCACRFAYIAQQFGQCQAASRLMAGKVTKLLTTIRLLGVQDCQQALLRLKSHLFQSLRAQ